MRSERRLPAFLCAAMLCTALVLASVAGSAGAATPPSASKQPNPQKLWKQYPLNPKRSGGATAGSVRAESATPRGHSGVPWMAFLSFAWIVAAVGWAISYARLLRRPQGPRAAGRKTVGTHDLSLALAGAVRRAGRTARTQQQSILDRSRKSH